MSESEHEADTVEGELPFTFTAADGAEREGSLLEAGTGPAPAALLLHGLASPDPPSGPILTAILAAELRDRGIGVAWYTPRVRADHDRFQPDRVDWDAEVADAAGALEALRQTASVDEARVHLFGLSLGGVTAPTVASQRPAGDVAGIASFGSTARPWRDYFIANSQIGWQRRGANLRQIELRSRYLTAWFTMLIETELSGHEMVALHPEMEKMGIDAQGHSGRSVAFWRQLARADIPGAYAGIECPILAIRGGSDAVCHPEDLTSITSAAQAANLDVTTVELEDLDHALLDCPSATESALTPPEGESRCDRLAEVVARWINGAPMDSEGVTLL